MAEQNDATTDEPTETTDLDALTAGREVRVTYEGVRGSRTVTAFVVDHEVEDAILDEDRNDHTILLAEPGARRPRFLRLGLETDATNVYDHDDALDSLRSLNSKSDHGQRLGWLEGLEVTEGRSEAALDVAGLLDTEEGEAVEADGTRYVVVDGGRRHITVEDPETHERESLTARPSGVYWSYEDERVTFDRLGETVEDEAAREVYEALESFGHGDARKVAAVEVDGTRYEVRWRNDPIKLTSPETPEDREYDHYLTLDALGLRLTPRVGDSRRVDAEDVTLIYESEPGDDEDDDGDAVAADGEGEQAFITGEVVDESTELADGFEDLFADDEADEDEQEVATDGGRVLEGLTDERREEIVDAVRSVRPSAPVEDAPGGRLRATVAHRHRDALAAALADVDAVVDRFERVAALGSSGLVVAYIYCSSEAEKRLARAESRAAAEVEARAERALEQGRW